MIHGLAGTYSGKPRSTDITRCTDFAVTKINVENNNGCEFDAGQTCVAQLILSAEVTNETGATLLYNWSFTPDPDVTDNGVYTENLYTLYVTGDTDMEVEVTVEMADESGATASLTDSFIVKHIAKVE